MVKKRSKVMCRLTPAQIQEKLLFIKDYVDASNPATGSSVDPNANVTMKTVATLGGEMVKDFRIQVNRRSAYEHISKEFGTDTAEKYYDYLEDHLIYRNDESADTPYTPYCVAISMYPLLESGTIPLGGSSSAPKHLDSFAGQYINMIYDVSAEFAGAVATAEFLLYFHYFAVKDYGKNYLKEVPEIVKSKFQQIIYTLNEPCAARNGQSVFFNLSVFDKFYFNSMFEHFYFPDGTQFGYEDFNELQKFFLEWLLEERKKSLLTFPVLTEASLDFEGEPKDKEWADYMADLRSRGLSFFSYNSENADSLSSCCLSDDEFIEIKDEHDNVSLIPIKTFVEQFNDNNDEEFESKIEKVYKVRAFNVKTNELEDKYITGVLAKPYNGIMITLSIDGRNITTTPDHIFTVKNKNTGQLESVSAMNLKSNFKNYLMPCVR